MKAKTRLFGEIDIEDKKIITLDRGMIGFPEYKHFALIFDEEKEKKDSSIMWLQSMEDGDIAFPVMNPMAVKEDYAPQISDDALSPLGGVKAEDVFVLVTVTVPKKVEDFSVNLKAPIIINMKNQKGMQVIVENDFPIKYKVYELLKKKKERAGGE